MLRILTVAVCTQASTLAIEASPLMQTTFMTQITCKYRLDQLIWVDEVKCAASARCRRAQRRPPRCACAARVSHRPVYLCCSRVSRLPNVTCSSAQISANENVVHRRYGWSLSGEACRRAGIAHGNKSYSALGVFWIGGMLDAFASRGVYHRRGVCAHRARSAPEAHGAVPVSTLSRDCGQLWHTLLRKLFRSTCSPSMAARSGFRRSCRLLSEPHGGSVQAGTPVVDGSPLLPQEPVQQHRELHSEGTTHRVAHAQARHCVLDCSTFHGTVGIPAWHGLLARFDMGERSPLFHEYIHGSCSSWRAARRGPQASCSASPAHSIGGGWGEYQ